ncbi:hypothetical protein DRQ09_10255 [candidate division KSB1 bacterium]|nr:MAG: hypothetical protein DRQ09_10255 [candidate division KSB1 bacterium]
MMEIFKTKEQLVYFREDRRELPCKDLDLDCLPDKDGTVPFGSYHKCYLYDPDKGSCPFLPMKDK